MQVLTDRWSLYTLLSAQLASKNLDSSEKFGLGGVNGVRAYSSDDTSGDVGWMSNIELRYALTPSWQFKTFFDHGAVKTNRDPWTSETNRQQRTAVGTGANWFGDNRQVSLQLAWRLGNPQTSAEPDHQPQMWLQASQGF